MSPLATFLAMRRLLPALLAASLVLGACGGDDDGDQAAVTSIPDETSTSTSTTTEPRTVAPDVIPQDESQITEEYVEQVLNELYEVSLESILLARESGLVDEPSLSRLEATSSDDVFERRANDLLDLASTGFQGLKADPGPMRFTVLELVDASSSCIVAEVSADSTALVEAPQPRQSGQREFVRLYPASEEAQASGLNPTAWTLDQFPVTFDGAGTDLDCEQS
jgi:hypothetical protein